MLQHHLYLRTGREQHTHYPYWFTYLNSPASLTPGGLPRRVSEKGFDRRKRELTL